MAVAPIRRAAAKRDIGEPARRWAEQLLRMPRSEAVEAVSSEPGGPWMRADLVPAFLKRGYFRGARIERPDVTGGEPYVELVYGGGRLGAAGYYLGSPSLEVPLGGYDDVARIMPGVYSFSVSQ